MTIKSSTCNKNFVYFFNDGIISRFDRQNQQFEVRDFKTSLWKPTDSPSLVSKMMQKKGIVQEHDVENLFQALRERALGTNNI